MSTTKTKKTAKAESEAPQKGSGLDQEKLLAEMQEVYANLTLDSFITVDVPFEDITINKPGVNAITKKMVQNIDFSYDGERKVYAIENLSFIRNIIEGYRAWKDGKEDVMVELPISSSVARKMKLTDGTHWVYN